MTFFAGIDSDQFDVAKLAAVKAQTNAVWVAYYLVAPSHPNAGWMGQRAELVAQGWGLAPVFVGQETIGPGSHMVTALQGAADGLLAAQTMASEGFPAQSWVYLDLENGPPFGNLQSGYVVAWCAAARANGYQPGIYCSHAMADQVSAANPGARIWAFHVDTTAQTDWAGGDFPEIDPAGSGCASAVIWQHADTLFLPQFDYLVDLDCSTMADPSAPGP